MPVTGPTDRLRSLAKQFGAIDSPEFRRAFGAALGAEAIKLLRDEFRRSRDPYGKPWPKLTSRTGKPLQDTGALESSFRWTNAPSGFTVTTDRKGAATHQYGATIRPVSAKALRFTVRGKPGAAGPRYYHYVAGKKVYAPGAKAGPRGAATTAFAQKVTIPRRQMMPEKDTGGVGPVWGKGLNTEAEQFMRDFFGGV